MAVVPPMSRKSTSWTPSRRPSSAAAVTPATGPDSSSVIGASAARSNEETPRSTASRTWVRRRRRPEVRSQVAEIGGDRWLHIGRKHGRARPFELAPLRADLVRGHDLDVAPELRQELGSATLMLGVRPRVEEADRDGIDVEGRRSATDSRPGSSSGSSTPRRCARSARAPRTAVVVARTAPACGTRVVQVGAVRAADLEHVAEPLRGHQGHTGSAPFGDGVDHDGTAVDQRSHVVRVELGALERRQDPLLEA